MERKAKDEAMARAVKLAADGRAKFRQAVDAADMLEMELLRAGFPASGAHGAADVAEDIVFNRTEHPEALLAAAWARKEG